MTDRLADAPLTGDWPGAQRPAEVEARFDAHWCAVAGIPLDSVNLLAWYAKAVWDRDPAWRDIKARFPEDFKNERWHPWRKLHTENYWCYYRKLPPAGVVTQDD